LTQGHGLPGPPQDGGGALAWTLIAEKNESARTTAIKTFLNIGFFSLLTKVIMSKVIRWPFATGDTAQNFSESGTTVN
jgi:hypothetical protein